MEAEDWWEDEDSSPRAEREREYARLASRMGSLGFADGAEAGHAAALQAAFDSGYRDGFGDVEAEAVRMTSALATVVEFYARHGAALGVPVSLSALVFGDESKLARNDIMQRLARLLGSYDPVADAQAPTRLARLFGWADACAGDAEFTKRQFDIAIDATIRAGAPSLRGVADDSAVVARAHEHPDHSHMGCS